MTESAARTLSTSVRDPIQLEVVRHALTAAADEMSLALQRTAYSTNIKTRLDFSCAIFDPRGRVVAQSFTQPDHLGALSRFVPSIIDEYGVERLEPGDAIACNDGHRGGVHLNDVVIVSPAFFDGELVALVATLAHHLDVGGGTPGGIAIDSREIYGEGLTIPPIRLATAKGIDENVFSLILNNVRARKETAGDFRAQLAGVNGGIRRFNEIVSRFGVAELRDMIDELLDYTEARAREEIRHLPEGVFEAEDYLDDDGFTDDAVVIHVKVTVADGMVIFDLSGSDRQRPGAMNATYSQTYSDCAYSLRALIGSDVPVNDGFYRVFEVVTVPGTVVHATHPSAIGGGWEVAFRACETALQAFAKAVPERLAAGSKGTLCNVAFGGRPSKNGEYYVVYEAPAGGYGARVGKDGIDAIQPHVQNTENSPVEEIEAGYPVRILKQELIANSEGPGRHRGGLGLRRDYYFDHTVVFSILSDRAKFPPWAIAGGLPARPSHFVLNPEDEAEELGSKVSIAIEPGDTVSVQTGGGGGYGPPWERDPVAVAEDVLDERVSPRRAREVYGVVFDDGGAVDAARTGALRQALKTRHDEAQQGRPK
jgi:N-methylhydantoinase B